MPVALKFKLLRHKQVLICVYVIIRVPTTSKNNNALIPSSAIRYLFQRAPFILPLLQFSYLRSGTLSWHLILIYQHGKRSSDKLEVAGHSLHWKHTHHEQVVGGKPNDGFQEANRIECCKLWQHNLCCDWPMNNTRANNAIHAELFTVPHGPVATNIDPEFIDDPPQSL